MEHVEPRRLLSALADGPEFLVNAQTTGMEAYPSVAVGGDGSFVVAWHASRGGSTQTDVFARLAANFGQSGTEFTRGDFNYDGTVNPEDFNVLAGRFGAVLAPATSIFGGSRGGSTPRARYRRAGGNA